MTLPAEPRPLQRTDHLAWLTIQGLVAAGIVAVSGSGFLGASGPAPSAAAWAYALTAWISTASLLAFVVWAITAPIALAARSRTFTFVVAPLLFGALAFVVQGDLVIYRLYRMHVNGMIVNLLTTAGGGDSFTLGRGTLISGAAMLTATLAITVGVSLLVLRPLAGRGVRVRRVLLIALPVLAAVVVADKLTFALADFHGRTDLTRVRRMFPLYRPVVFSRFLRGTLGSTDPAPPAAVGGALVYPRAPLTWSAHAKPWNVVIVAIEGLRADIVGPETMPFLSRWGAQGITCANHVSGGNASRFGIFSLLYGLDGTLWRSFRDERLPPVLVSELKKRGYAFRVLSGTDLHYPEFRQTAFVEIPEAITDAWPGGRVDRDRLQTDAFLSFLDTAREPFFVFNFYDATHQPYLYPPEDEIFRPVLPTDQLNYVKLSEGYDDQVPLLLNRYKNSLHYVDREIARLVDGLERRGLTDRTLVFVCGDHGEEFGEDGLVGHNSSFDAWQVRTPMIVHVPGSPPRRVERPTSHQDVAPTILGTLGVTNAADDYSHGASLLGDRGPERRVVASWDQAAVLDGDATVVFGTESTDLHVDVFDAAGRLMPGREAAHREAILEAFRRVAAFRR